MQLQAGATLPLRAALRICHPLTALMALAGPSHGALVSLAMSCMSLACTCSNAAVARVDTGCSKECMYYYGDSLLFLLSAGMRNSRAAGSKPRLPRRPCKAICATMGRELASTSTYVERRLLSVWRVWTPRAHCVALRCCVGVVNRMGSVAAPSSQRTCSSTHAGMCERDGRGGGECVCEQASKTAVAPVATLVMTEPAALLGVCCAVLHCDRESSDHGPVNSWDRQPFLTDLSDKSPSFIPLYNELSLNFMVANYGGSCRSVWSFLSLLPHTTPLLLVLTEQPTGAAWTTMMAAVTTTFMTTSGSLAATR